GPDGSRPPSGRRSDAAAQTPQSTAVSRDAAIRARATARRLVAREGRWYGPKPRRTDPPRTAHTAPARFTFGPLERRLERPPVRARGCSTSVDAAVDNRDDEYADRAGAEDLWSKVSLAVQSQLAESTWNTWFRGVRALDLRADDDVLVLAVPNALAIERIRRSYVGILNDAAQTLSGTPTAAARSGAGPPRGCALGVDTAPRQPALMASPPAETDAPAHEVPPPRLPADDSAPRPKGSLNPKCTFDNFIVGASNRFAQAA